MWPPVAAVVWIVKRRWWRNPPLWRAASRVTRASHSSSSALRQLGWHAMMPKSAASVLLHSYRGGLSPDSYKNHYGHLSSRFPLSMHTLTCVTLCPIPSRIAQCARHQSDFASLRVYHAACD